MLSLTHDLWYEAGSTIWAQAGTLRAAAHWLSATAAEINGVVALEAPSHKCFVFHCLLECERRQTAQRHLLEASPLCHERLRFDNRRVHGDRRERTHSNAWWNGPGRTKVGNDHLVAICEIVGLWRHQTIRATSRHIIHGVTIEVATQTRNALVEEVARQIDVHVVVLLGRVIDHNFDGRSVEKSQRVRLLVGRRNLDVVFGVFGQLLQLECGNSVHQRAGREDENGFLKAHNQLGVDGCSAVVVLCLAGLHFQTWGLDQIIVSVALEIIVLEINCGKVRVAVALAGSPGVHLVVDCDGLGGGFWRTAFHPDLGGNDFSRTAWVDVGRREEWCRDQLDRLWLVEVLGGEFQRAFAQLERGCLQEHGHISCRSFVQPHLD